MIEDDPGAIEWIGREASSELAGQLDIVDALDAKAGILFAYLGALLIATFQLMPDAQSIWREVALAAGICGAFADVAELAPRTFNQPPAASKLKDALLGADPYGVAETRRNLVDDQIEAIKSNAAILREKTLLLWVAVIGAIVQTFALVMLGAKW